MNTRDPLNILLWLCVLAVVVWVLFTLIDALDAEAAAAILPFWGKE